MTETETRISALATEAVELFIEAVRRLPDEYWDRPSNLEDWSVRELVGHATGSAAKVVALAANDELWGPSEPADWIHGDPVARLRELAESLRVALADADLTAPRMSPHGEVPLHRALMFPVSDLIMHSWDVHRSQGELVELPEEPLAFCGELVASLPEELLRRPGGFGPAQTAPEHASATTRLMAHLGRSVATEEVR